MWVEWVGSHWHFKSYGIKWDIQYYPNGIFFPLPKRKVNSDPSGISHYRDSDEMVDWESCQIIPLGFPVKLLQGPVINFIWIYITLYFCFTNLYTNCIMSVLSRDNPTLCTRDKSGKRYTGWLFLYKISFYSVYFTVLYQFWFNSLSNVIWKLVIQINSLHLHVLFLLFVHNFVRNCL